MLPRTLEIHSQNKQFIIQSKEGYAFKSIQVETTSPKAMAKTVFDLLDLTKDWSIVVTERNIQKGGSNERTKKTDNSGGTA